VQRLCKKYGYFSVAKSVFLPCCWKCHLILFLPMRLAMEANGWFNASNCFFFSLSYRKRYILAIFVFDILILILIFLIFNFFLDNFINVLFIFNLVFQLQFVIYYVFQFGSYSFYFYFFFLAFFIKILFVFNFILRSKLMVYYFM
jgi:hypothetical protein